MGGKVDLVGVRAGWLKERLILTGSPGGKEMESWHVKPQLFMYSLIN